MGGNRAFTVTITSGSNYATFTSTESLQSYQQNQQQLQGDNLKITLEDDYVSQEEWDWMFMASQLYGIGKKNVHGMGHLLTLYDNVHKDFKRSYAYKIERISKVVGKPAKAGKIFQGSQKLAKKAKFLGPLGNALTFGTIGYEYTSGTWDTHTHVDSAILVVGIVASIWGAPIVVVGIAIYGILDYAFDISEGIDKEFGKNSDFWNEKPIYNFPRKNTPLFNQIEIDKTYVAPKFKLPPNFNY